MMPSKRQQNKGAEAESARPSCPRGCPGRWASHGQPRPWRVCRAGHNCWAVFVGCCHATLSREAPGQVLEHSGSPARHLLQLLPGAGGCGSWRPDEASHPLRRLRHPHGTRRLLGIAGSPGRPTLRRGCPGPSGASCVLYPRGHEAGRPWVLATLQGFCLLSSGFPNVDMRPSGSGDMCNQNSGPRSERGPAHTLCSSVSRS